MKQFFLFSLAAAFLGLASACDKINTPVKTTFLPPLPTGDTVQRILLEDYTGQGCGFCPGAAVVARQLDDNFGDQLIVLTIHAGWFSDTTNAGGNPYSTTFSTPMGEAFNDEWTIDAIGNPQGMVNRKAYQSDIVLNKDNWGSAISEIIDNAPSMNLSMDVTNNNGELDISVDYIALSDLSGNYSLTVLVTETDIYDWQKNYSGGDPQYPAGDISNYKHEHVLRDNISAIWGDAIISGNFDTGTTGSMSYNYTLNPNWVVENVGIIAYVSNSDTKEIIQVYETHP